ncbi:hypothetical protein CU102_18040 [Phyllobacterium brassicacearum]|uniref:Uncharacterized protein n=1 Tax=Phyllobacterium brassicacearum TaxID=314235 RepID=A0A2P7BJQ7_9HYPH|nr:hypothetical protein [Phyllobacterium brassicacearum]PSH66710.1 hypothetical protein CU102_18040 [Phyllobacterium brassicacearum]TDQ32032.1 hypothetical protein DEV91_106129 [Phyllobacterium brassicacearum]
MTKIVFTPKFALFLFIFLATNALYFWLKIDPVDVSVSLDESGPIETVQLAYLAGGALLFFAAAAATLSGTERMFCIAMAMLGLVFFLREMEVDNAGPISAYLESRLLRTHEAIVVAAVISFYLVFRWSLIGGVMSFVFSKSAWPFYVAAILLLAGATFDIFHGSVPNQIKEEIFECSSYLTLLLIAGAICYQQPGARIRSTSADFLMVVVTVSLFAGACWLTEQIP